MNIFISADVEGVAGIASWSQIIADGDDYSIGRSLMTGEVNAAIEGAIAAGAQQVVVNDSHARMTNLLPETLNPSARLISGHFKPHYMLQGLDESFDAAFFVGYHGAIGEPEAILAHTYNPRAIWEAKVDGRVVGEIGINYLMCEYFGVPLTLVTGDQSTAREARAIAPAVRTAEVKRSFGRYSADSMSPLNARALIRQTAKESLASLPSLEPVRRPVDVELTFLVADMAAMAEWVKGVQRTGPRTVTYRSADGLEAYQRFHAIVTLTRSIAE